MAMALTAICFSLFARNAIYRISARTATLHRVAGTGDQGYSGDGGPRWRPLAGPKGLAYSPDQQLYCRYREPRHPQCQSGEWDHHHGARTDQRGDGPEPDPSSASSIARTAS
jgi:hypothetical protein